MSCRPSLGCAAGGFRCRERVVLNFGADLECMLAPVRRALHERARRLCGDFPAAALQLIAEGQARKAPPFECDLILAALDELSNQPTTGLAV